MRRKRREGLTDRQDGNWCSWGHSLPSPGNVQAYSGVLREATLVLRSTPCACLFALGDYPLLLPVSTTWPSFPVVKAACGSAFSVLVAQPSSVEESTALRGLAHKNTTTVHTHTHRHMYARTHAARTHAHTLTHTHTHYTHGQTLAWSILNLLKVSVSF